MEKFNRLLPQGLLLSFVTKMLLVSSSISDMGIVVALAAIVCIQIYLEKKADSEEIRAVVNKQNECIQTMAVEHAKMKSMLEGIKLKEGFRAAEGVKRAI